MLLISKNIQLSMGASARKQLFCKLWLCVGLCGLQMCCFVRWLFIFGFLFLSFSSKLSVRFGLLHLAANGQRYAQYGISKPLHYQDAERLKRATDAELHCIPRIAYDRMLPTGRSCYLSVFLSFIFNFAVFSVRALGQPYSLASFGLRFGSCDLPMCMDARLGLSYRVFSLTLFKCLVSTL
jgi:hypothetical protein